MKFTNYIFLAFLLTFQGVISQTNLSVKSVVKKLSIAGEALHNFECEKSLLVSKEALNEAHQLKNHQLMAKAYNIIGLNFDEFSEPKTAIIYYEKALSHALLTENDTIQEWIYNNLGSTYTYRKIDLHKGIEFYKKALFFANKLKDNDEVAYTQLNIAGAYINSKDYINGIKYLDKCKSHIENSDLLEAKISLYTNYGNYYNIANQNDEADLYYSKAVAISKENSSELIDSNIAEVYLDYSNFLTKIHNDEKAKYFLDLHKTLKEKIYSQEKIDTIKNIVNEIQFDEYERQIEQIENENQKHLIDLSQSRTIDILFGIVILVLLLLVISLLRNNRLRDKTNKILKATNEELLIAKEKAETATQLKTQFVSTITHELRTPLYGVVGITNIIIDEHKELANSPHINSLKFSAGYLLSLVNDLLQINKIEEKRIVLENMIFNISDEINTITDSLKFIAKKNNNKLFIEIDEAIPETLIGDKLRLSQVFMNLVSNALKFTKYGKVTVIAKLDREEGTKKFITFYVKDTGVGIAEADQEKIFEKFVQIERKEGDYQGTGLGLSIVKKLVEIFGGKIELESVEGKGTTFYFTIPFESDDKKKIEIINNIVVDLSEEKFYHVLVVEDNKINQIVTRKTLENNKFKCTVVDDGYAAVEILDTDKFDIILMDINMPIINGFETTKLIRKKGHKLPIVALTAFDKQEVSEQALSCGMNDVIIKPFEQSKLFQIISNMIDKNN